MGEWQVIRLIPEADIQYDGRKRLEMTQPQGSNDIGLVWSRVE